jgi:hypothetical protein
MTNGAPIGSGSSGGGGGGGGVGDPKGVWCIKTIMENSVCGSARK